MLTVKTPEEVLVILETAFPPRPVPEEVPLEEARGRVLCAPVTAGEFVPGFDRSTVDGYAVRAEDTFGCSEAIPALLTPSLKTAFCCCLFFVCLFVFQSPRHSLPGTPLLFGKGKVSCS